MDEKPTYQELERKVHQLEQALQTGEDKYRILLDESSDPTFSFYPDGTYRFVNKAFAEGVGKSIDEIIGHRIWDIFPGEEGDKRFSIVKRVFETGKPKTIEVRVPRPEGDQFYITTVKAVKDNHGKVISVICSSKNITDRKETEETLRESEERHRLFFENAPIGIIHYSNKGIITAVNEAIVTTFGSSREKLIGLDIDSIPNKKFAKEVYKSLNGKPGSFEGEYSSYTGEKASFIRATWIPIKQKDEILAGVGIVEDITERKKAEEALTTKASLERIISETSRRFLTLTELDQSINACLANIGRFCAAGRAYLFQFASDGTTMKNTHEWCAPGVNPEIENLQGLPLEMFPWWMKLLESGGNIHVKNVAELPPEARAEKEILEAQNIKSVLVVPFLVENRLAGFLGFDNVASTIAWGEKELIPLRTLAEIIGTAVTRKRAVEALRQSEAQFRDLADMLPQIVFETDVKGNLTFVNQNAFNTFGYTKDDFASGLNAVQMIVPKDRDRAADTMRQIIRGLSDRIGSEYNVRKKDGTEFPVIIYLTRFLREGNPAGLRGIMIDITDRKRAEEEREKLQAQLIQAQKMEAIGTLAGGIAHNLNNILMGVQGRTSLMIMGKDPSNPDYEHLRGIEEYIKNAVELTRDLLGYARGGKYEVKPTDLNTLIKHENRMFGRTKREIRVHEKYEKNLWTVEVDQSQIKQALLNLYVNAWQAMPGEGDLYTQTENVTFDKECPEPFEIAPGRYVKISVTDTGVGMDAATQERIFDPFFSTKDVGQGSGLGLSSVYGIIKNHGGFINVYSASGVGATFNIYLPASEREAEEEGPDPKRHEIQYGQGTVLLVDDEDMIVEVGQAMLEKLGYRAFFARSGQGALDLYEKQGKEIDLVILDMIMPGMGGGETYDRLREIDGDVKVILSSGYSIEGQAKKIMDRGCSGFIQKPFAMEALSRMVREVLDGVNG